MDFDGGAGPEDSGCRRIKKGMGPMLPMRRTPFRRALLGLSVWLLGFTVWGSELPRLIVEAPPALAPVAREIEALAPEALEAAARLVGGDTSALMVELSPITVVLVPEGSAAARSVPSWISGYAIDGLGPGQIVLLPARVHRYPDFGLGALLRHELTHVFVARAAGGGEVPRWFNEGLAMAVGREPDLGDRARVALAVIDDDSLPLARLDRAFSGGETEVHAAYALAGDFVRLLLERHGRDSAARILARVAHGERFRDAFQAVTGQTLAEFEATYWKRRTFLDRWVPVISSSVLLWGGIALLALAAIRRRRSRDAERLARWGVEEGDGDGQVESALGGESEIEVRIDSLKALDDDWPPRKPRSGRG